MPWMGAAIGAGASLIGGAMGSSASKDAAAAQAKAAAEQLALQKQMYSETVARNQPWLASGGAANTKLSNLLGTGTDTGSAGYGSLTGNFSMDDYLNNQDPGYQFGMTQGQNALNAQNAATGGAQSGAALKAASRYVQDYAGTKYQSAFDRWRSNRGDIYNMLSGQGAVGQSAANNTATAGNNYATGGGAAMGNLGAANASGYLGSSNAYSNAIGNAMNNYNNMSMMNKLFPGQGSPTPASGFGGGLSMGGSAPDFGTGQLTMDTSSYF